MELTLVITSIPTRESMLRRAQESVSLGWRQPDATIVCIDHDRVGAAANRDRGLRAVETPYVAFLDDDDEIYVHHLLELLPLIKNSDADLVYPWFDVVGGTDPFPNWENKPWDPEHPHQVPITFVAKTQSLLDAGGFTEKWDDILAQDPGTDEFGNRAGEDFRLILRLNAAGARIVHHPHRTWAWHHHSNNTMGLPSRW